MYGDYFLVTAENTTHVYTILHLLHDSRKHVTPKKPSRKELLDLPFKKRKGKILHHKKH